MNAGKNTEKSREYTMSDGTCVEVPHNKGFNLPAPTSDDLLWADELTKMRWSITGTAAFRKGSKFGEAISDSRLWCVVFAINLNDKYSQEQKFIKALESRNALEIALKEKNKEILDALLAYDFPKKYGFNKASLKKLAKRENRDILTQLVEEKHLDLNDKEQHVLYSAAARQDELMCSFILDLGSEYESVLTRLSTTSDGFCILKRAIKEFNSTQKQKILEETPKLEHKSIDVASEDISKNMPIWEAIDHNTIIRIDNIQATKTLLQTMFNFKARNVKTIISIDNGTPTVTVENFKDIEDDSVLYQAWQKLDDNPKTKPDDFTGNTGFIVLKPSKNPNIKIEK